MGEFTNKVKDALVAITDLKIITIVGNATVNNAFNKEVTTIEIGSDQKSIVTSISLTQGDITNVIDPEFVPGQENAVRDFHEKQVQLGQTIISNNITLLKNISKELIEMIGNEPDTSTAANPNPEESHEDAS